MGSGDHRKRQNIDKEDRGRKLVTLVALFQKRYLVEMEYINRDCSPPNRTDEHGRKEFRERDADHDRERDKERRQREKERIRRQDEDRRKRRERQDGENMFKKQEDEAKEERERASEKKKSDNAGDSSHSERAGKPARDNKKEESGKRERLRNKVTALKGPTLYLFSDLHF